MSREFAHTDGSALPVWLGKREKINEPLFCEELLKENQLRYINGSFFSTMGAVDENELSAQIYKTISPYVTSNVGRHTENIMKALKLRCFGTEIIALPDEIHVQNGVLKTDGTFIPEIRFCAHRMNVNYDPAEKRIPVHFLKFLDDMLDAEDIITLQEYLGYCLIPQTNAQKAMFIIGNGGEGKSCTGVVMQSIFGSSMVTGNLHSLETNRFSRYKLLNKLVMVDDDVQMSAFSSTGTIKNLITSRIPVEVEAKGIQSMQAELYARFICFGNGSPKALYDKSDGFTRRLMILTTNPVPKNRVSDPNITDKFIAEKDLIFLWMLEGLKRLIANNFRFTISERTKQNLSDMAADNCNIAEFLAYCEYVSFGEEYEVSSNQLYGGYCHWCSVNGLTQLKQDTFTGWLKSHSQNYNISYTTNVKKDNKHIRGFKGIRTSYVPFVA